MDLRTAVLAILRINDGKHFVDSSHAPMPQSEGEIGFRREEDNQFLLRNQEVSQVQKTFEQFYTNRLQLLGQRIEAQKQLKKQIETQKQADLAKPQISSKTEDFAAKYRAKQLAKKNQSSNKNLRQTEQSAQLDTDQPGIDTFEWLQNQKTKTTSGWQ